LITDHFPIVVSELPALSTFSGKVQVMQMKVKSFSRAVQPKNAHSELSPWKHPSQCPATAKILAVLATR
jgi:hypothetical protein